MIFVKVTVIPRYEPEKPRPTWIRASAITEVYTAGKYTSLCLGEHWTEITESVEWLLSQIGGEH